MPTLSLVVPTIDGPQAARIPVSPDIRRGRRRLGGTGEEIVRDDDEQILCVVTADVEADLDDLDVKRAMESLWAAFRLARSRRSSRSVLKPA